jgi:hypothetical protein
MDFFRLNFYNCVSYTFINTTYELIAMQTKRSLILIFSVILYLSAMLVCPARADETTESFTVYTEKQVYMEGEQVNIYVKADSIDPGQNITVTDVIVYDPRNSIVAEWHNISVTLMDTTHTEYVGTLTAMLEGTYTVYAEATGCPWRIPGWWFFFCWCHNCHHDHVIPEYPLGTIMAMATVFGALAFYTVRKSHKVGF